VWNTITGVQENCLDEDIITLVQEERKKRIRQTERRKLEIAGREIDEDIIALVQEERKKR
jgi:hypothetical protein